MTLTDVSVSFTLGLVGSLHCVQMCGPLVLAYSLPLGAAGRGRQAVAHLAYTLGRVAAYAILGAVAGSIGGGVGGLRPLAGAVNTAALVAGGLMVLGGLSMAGVVGLPAAAARFVPRAPRLAAIAGGLLRSPSVGAKLSLGLVLGLLPCGLLYAALLKAVETGSPASGAASMVAFGLGTAGALVAAGLFSGAIAARLGRWAGRLPAAAVLLTGVFLLWRGMMGIGPAAPVCH